jgi:hypothetical protein
LRERHGGEAPVHAGGFILELVSLNQSYHLAPLYSVKCVHDVVPVEYGLEMFHRSGSVARPGLNIFTQDASSVLNGTQERILVGPIHDAGNSRNRTDSRLGKNFRSRWHCGLMSWRLSRLVAHYVGSRVGFRQDLHAVRSGAACHAGVGPPLIIDPSPASDAPNDDPYATD